MPSRRTLLAASGAAALASAWTGAGLAQTATGANGANNANNDPVATLAVPAEVRQALPGALWAGSGRLRFFGFDVYDAHLWVAPGFKAAQFAQHGLALELTYLRVLSGRDIAKRSLQEMRRTGDLSAPQAQRWAAYLQAALPDVNAGDRLTGLHHPGVGARFWHNGQPRPPSADPEFSLRFFGIWLSEATSEGALRTELLSRLRP